MKEGCSLTSQVPNQPHEAVFQADMSPALRQQLAQPVLTSANARAIQSVRLSSKIKRFLFFIY